MEYAQIVTVIIVLIGVLIVLRSVVRGPTVMDRILAVNVIGTKTIVLVALVGFLQVEQTAREGSAVPDFNRAGFFLDIALAYALINFIATIAILRFLEARARRRAEEAAAGTPPDLPANPEGPQDAEPAEGGTP